ncbi:hypothetical protein ARMSODRAFT_1017565 [Armillaria solidipes]|uniref:Uncharacterized protein n=1 Tax=Armillaria solidipes TaxID=1076256 RepID=A0A2H3BUX5_9AGAR|nr:hypothetical protein ARMSODRAFT_1017565 [Armillaria solidipes]
MDPVNTDDIIDRKRKRQQTERSKDSKAQAADSSDDSSTITQCPKKKAKVPSATKKLIRKVLKKLTLQKSSDAQASACPATPAPSANTLPPTGTQDMATNIRNFSLSASVKSIELPDLITVEDSDDEEDTPSIMDTGAAEDNDESKLHMSPN